MSDINHLGPRYPQNRLSRANFTDPGWCDTHTATWDFGDCTTPVPATVRERHDPPFGCGIAAATHRYDCCGSFHAVCTVTDDDGGVGEDWLIVCVVDIRNGNFEGGFHTHALGGKSQRYSNTQVSALVEHLVYGNGFSIGELWLKTFG